MARRLRFSARKMFIVILLSILLPPLGVFLRVGFTGHFFLSLLLTLIGYVPGLVHAIWVVVERSPENARLRAYSY